jgi:hypothetical protein
MNMLQRKANKYFDINKESSARKVITSKSQNKRDDHGNDKK